MKQTERQTVAARGFPRELFDIVLDAYSCLPTNETRNERNTFALPFFYFNVFSGIIGTYWRNEKKGRAANRTNRARRGKASRDRATLIGASLFISIFYTNHRRTSRAYGHARVDRTSGGESYRSIPDGGMLGG